jgi:hypothetical protein
MYENTQGSRLLYPAQNKQSNLVQPPGRPAEAKGLLPTTLLMMNPG